MVKQCQVRILGLGAWIYSLVTSLILFLKIRVYNHQLMPTGTYLREYICFDSEKKINRIFE